MVWAMGIFFLTEQNSRPGSRLLEIEGPMTFTIILEMAMALQWILTMASRPVISTGCVNFPRYSANGTNPRIIIYLNSPNGMIF